MTPRTKRSRWRIGLASAFFVVVAAIVGLAIAAASADNPNRIAKGITIGNVKVGGDDAKTATAKVEKVWSHPFNTPVRVHHHEKEFLLTPGQSHLSIDVESAVRAALAESRSGNFLTRGWRSLTGGEIHKEIPVKINFSRGAVDQFVTEIEKSISRPVIDASLSYHPGRIDQHPSQTGLAINKAKLHKEVLASLNHPEISKTIKVETRWIKPKITSSQLPERFPSVIMVDREKFTLTLYKNLEKYKQYKIAVGDEGVETPGGTYSIQSKQIDPDWHVPNSKWAEATRKKMGKVIPGGHPKNPLKARWMGIANGAGIHGTDAVNSLGSAASHGCIRMAVKDVIDLFDRVSVGAPVFIH